MLVIALTNLEKVQEVPASSMVNLVLAVLVLVVAVFLIKQASSMNKGFVFMIAAVIVIIVGMTWVYQRNEPKFLTPFIDSIAPYFPKTPPPYSKRPEPGSPAPTAPNKQAPTAPNKQAPPPASKVY
jgi:hypothetical protein